MRVLLSSDELAAGIDRLSAEVRAVVGGRPLTIVGVLTGSIVNNAYDAGYDRIELLYKDGSVRDTRLQARCC